MHFRALAYFEEVGHSTKCCHLVTNNFLIQFFRTLIRACTGSFANVCGSVNLENINWVKFWFIKKWVMGPS